MPNTHKKIKTIRETGQMNRQTSCHSRCTSCPSCDTWQTCGCQERRRYMTEAESSDSWAENKRLLHHDRETTANAPYSGLPASSINTLRILSFSSLHQNTINDGQLLKNSPENFFVSKCTWLTELRFHISLDGKQLTQETLFQANLSASNKETKPDINSNQHKIIKYLC